MSDELSPERILVVGGAGKMGRWLCRVLGDQGHHIRTLDPAGAVDGIPEARDLATAVEEVDVVLLATPLAAGARILGTLLDLRPKALVADVFSLKSHVVDRLKLAAREGLSVASLHPLFGPNAPPLGGRTLAVLDCGNARAADRAEALFRGTALMITRIPVERHDEYMQYVLGLSHLVSILFFTTLVDGGRSFRELEELQSTTFRKQVRTAEDVARENPHLYHEIQHLNHYSTELYARVRRSLARIESAALDPDPRAFGELIEAGRQYFAAELPADLS